MGEQHDFINYTFDSLYTAGRDFRPDEKLYEMNNGPGNSGASLNGGNNMYKTVYDLSPDQMEELKESYAIQLENDGISWGELAAASEIPDEIILEHYNGITFTDDDFFCTAGMEVKPC